MHHPHRDERACVARHVPHVDPSPGAARASLDGVRRFRRSGAPSRCAIAVLGALALVGCLRTLDESLIGASGGSSGTSGGSATDGGGTGGGGTSGSSGTSGSAGSDAATDAPTDAPDDGSKAPVLVPYDAAKYPVQRVNSGLPGPAIIATDANDVFRLTRSAGGSSPLNRYPARGGSGASFPGTFIKPRGVAASAVSLFVFVIAQQSFSSDGVLLRAPKDASAAPDTLTLDPNFAEPEAISFGPDLFVYATAKATSAGSVQLIRFSIEAAATTDEVLYVSTTGGETAGDVAVGGTRDDACVYWISNRNLYVLPTSGGTRKAALATPISDAVGLTADTLNFYYTRSNGEVWQRPLFTGVSCDVAGAPEKKIAGRFTGIGDVVTYGGKVTWAARGDTANDYAGGGVFTTPIGGGDVTTIAPPDDGVDDLDHSANEVVFSTLDGGVRSVPKTPR